MLKDKWAEKIWTLATDTEPSNMTEDDKTIYRAFVDMFLLSTEEDVECRNCEGSGKERCGFCGGMGHKEYGGDIRECTSCGGNGEGDICPTCKGSGSTKKSSADILREGEVKL